MAYADVLTALADPTRRQIFESLLGESKTVGDLAARLPVSRPAVSQHLRVLESAHLVYATPQGNRRLYSIQTDGLMELRRYLDRFWSDALSAYGAEVERRKKRKKRT